MRCGSVDAGASGELIYDVIRGQKSPHRVFSHNSDKKVAPKVASVQPSRLVQLYITGILVLLVKSDGYLSIHHDARLFYGHNMPHVLYFIGKIEQNV